MSILRYTACLLMLTSTTFSAAPKAVLLGPSTAIVNADITFRFTGTITDGDVRFLYAGGPEEIPCSVAYVKSDATPPVYTPAFGTAHPTKPGTYIFCLVAKGVPPGSSSPDESFAFLFVTVTDAGPNPGPTPTPTPNPNPTPRPTPPPAPDNSPMWAVAVFPATTPAELETLLAGVHIRQAARELGVYYRIAYSGSPELTSKNLTPYLSGVALPALIVQRADGTVIDSAVPMKDETQVSTFLRHLRRK